MEMRLENGYVTVDGRELLGDSVYGGYKVSDLTFEDGGKAASRSPVFWRTNFTAVWGKIWRWWFGF